MIKKKELNYKKKLKNWLRLLHGKIQHYEHLNSVKKFQLIILKQIKFIMINLINNKNQYIGTTGSSI